MALASALREWVAPWWRYHRHGRLRRRTGRARDLVWVAETEGDMTGAEAERLYDLAREARGGAIVEIGSFRGKSTVACALGARAGGRARVYAIDPFLPFVGPCGGHFGPADRVHLLQNLLLAGVAEDVWLLNAPSTQAAAGWREPIALLWIDGDHSYQAVQRDVTAWTPFLVAGGTVALHDAREPSLGPHRVVDELLAAGGWERAAGADTLTVLRRAV